MRLATCRRSLIVKIIALCLALAVAFGEPAFAQPVAHSAPASMQAQIAHALWLRALRCRGMAHPKLYAGVLSWSLDYAVIGWDFEQQLWRLSINSEGALRITSVDANGVPLTVKQRQLSRPEVDQLARLIDEQDLLCLSAVPAMSTRSAGNYRQVIQMTTPNYRRLLSVDACYEVNDRLAWEAVTDRLFAWLKADLGPVTPETKKSDALRPTLKVVCTDEELATVMRLDQRQQLLGIWVGKTDR